MIKGEEWESYIPEESIPLIKKYKGIERIQALARTDDKQEGE